MRGDTPCEEPPRALRRRGPGWPLGHELPAISAAVAGLVGQAHDLLGDLTDLDVAVGGHAQEIVEGTRLVDRVPLHDDAQGLSDQLAAGESSAQLFLALG